jgi:hypothetical protein
MVFYSSFFTKSIGKNDSVDKDHHREDRTKRREKDSHAAQRRSHRDFFVELLQTTARRTGQWTTTAGVALEGELRSV